MTGTEMYTRCVEIQASRVGGNQVILYSTDKNDFLQNTLSLSFKRPMVFDAGAPSDNGGLP